MTTIKGDGFYCVLYSILHGMKEVDSVAIPTVEGLLKMIRFELLLNLSFYASWIHEDEDLIQELDRYVSSLQQRLSRFSSGSSNQLSSFDD